MPKMLFNQILDETLNLPADISTQRKQEIYTYAFELAIPDHRHGHRVLINEGNIADSVYLLLKGSCRFYYYSPVHKQELIPFLMLSPCFLAEGRSFRKALPARFSIDVFEPSLVYKLSKSAVTAIIEKYPEVAAEIRLMIKQQTHDFKLWKRGLKRRPARERYIHLCKDKSHLIGAFKKKDIASHLGIKDPSFSRLLRRLGDKFFFLPIIFTFFQK